MPVQTPPQPAPAPSIEDLRRRFPGTPDAFFQTPDAVTNPPVGAPPPNPMLPSPAPAPPGPLGTDSGGPEFEQGGAGIGVLTPEELARRRAGATGNISKTLDQQLEEALAHQAAIDAANKNKAAIDTGRRPPSGSGGGSGSGGSGSGGSSRSGGRTSGVTSNFSQQAGQGLGNTRAPNVSSTTRSPFSDDVRSRILAALDQAGQIPNIDDPILRDQQEAFTRATERATERANIENAEFLSSQGVGQSGASEVAREGLQQFFGEQTAANASQLVAGELQRRRAELQNLLGQAGALGDADLTRELQARIADADLELRHLLGTGALDLERQLGFAGLSLQEQLGLGGLDLQETIARMLLNEDQRQFDLRFPFSFG